MCEEQTTNQMHRYTGKIIEPILAEYETMYAVSNRAHSLCVAYLSSY